MEKKHGLPKEFYEEIFQKLNEWKKVVDRYRKDDNDEELKIEVKAMDSFYKSFHDFYEDIPDTYEHDEDISDVYEED